MQQIFRYRKFIGTIVSISIFLLYFPHTPAQADLIATEEVIHRDLNQQSDRERIRAFLRRTDVMVQLQARGIRYEEALFRVDSLTDREVASIAGRLDQVPAGAESSNYEFDGSLLAIIGLIIYALFMAIAIYFSRTADRTDKPQADKETSEKQSPETPVAEDGGQQTDSD